MFSILLNNLKLIFWHLEKPLGVALHLDGVYKWIRFCCPRSTGLAQPTTQRIFFSKTCLKRFRINSMLESIISKRIKTNLRCKFLEKCQTFSAYFLKLSLKIQVDKEFEYWFLGQKINCCKADLTARKIMLPLIKMGGVKIFLCYRPHHSTLSILHILETLTWYKVSGSH